MGGRRCGSTMVMTEHDNHLEYYHACTSHRFASANCTPRWVVSATGGLTTITRSIIYSTTIAAQGMIDWQTSYSEATQDRTIRNSLPLSPERGDKHRLNVHCILNHLSMYHCSFNFKLSHKSNRSKNLFLPPRV